METTLKKIVRHVNQAFNEGRLEGFLDHCTDDVRWTMVGKEPLTGKPAISDFMGQMKPGNTMEISIRNIIAEGNLVACDGTMRMNNSGGSPYNGAFCDIYLFDGDRIAELHSYVVDFK